jgi:hypothetical protein
LNIFLSILFELQSCSGSIIDRAQQKKNIPQAKPVISLTKQDLVVASITGAKPSQQKRSCFHPGVFNLGPNVYNFNSESKVTGNEMLSAMFNFIWPKVQLQLLLNIFLLIHVSKHYLNYSRFFVHILIK